MLIKIALNLGMTGAAAAPEKKKVGGRRPTERDVDYLRARRWEARQDAIRLAQQEARRALKRAQRAAKQLESEVTVEARDRATSTAELASQAVLNLRREVARPIAIRLEAPPDRAAELARATSQIMREMAALQRTTERLLREAEELTLILAVLFAED